MVEANTRRTETNTLSSAASPSRRRAEKDIESMLIGHWVLGEH